MFSRRNVLRVVMKHQTTHAGLWLDKYLMAQTEESKDATTKGADRRPQHTGRKQQSNATNDEQSDDADGKGKKESLIRDVQQLPIPEGYRKAYDRRVEGFRANPEGFLDREATVEGRMIIGLGAKGALEAGLRLEHTWGVPIVPGSALKGLAAAAAHHLLEDEQWRKRGADEKRKATNFDELFGTTDECGKVIFHDAWWIPESENAKIPIHLDVMTVHHPDYYQYAGGGNPPPPSDMDSPTPIPFASASGTYMVVLEGEIAWCEAAMDILKIGLAELGIGAKTNAGYGRMRLNHESALEKQECAQLEEAARAVETLKRAEEERAAIAERKVQEERRQVELARELPGVIGAINKGNAEARVTEGLARYSGALKKDFAVKVVKNLDRKWLEDPKRKDKLWVIALLAAFNATD